MNQVILEIEKDDKELVEFINQHSDFEVLEEKNFLGETLLLSVAVPLTVEIVKMIVVEMYKNKKNPHKRVIVTPDGKYELSGFTIEESVDFIMKLKDS